MFDKEMPFSQDAHPLIRQFREFYVYAAQLRAQALDPTLMTTSAGTGVGRLASAASAASAVAAGAVAVAEPPVAVGQVLASNPGHIWQQMAAYLDRKLYQANQVAGSVAFYLERELIYVMAAMADEIFLHLEWSGQRYWLHHLMEQRLFHTQVAGQEIFRRIERILTRQDLGADELAAVYLMALALGFRGQYWRDEDQPEIAVCRRSLLERLLWSDQEMASESQTAFPDAYDHRVTEGAPVRLPVPQTWWFALAALVVVWLAVSTAGWLVLTQTTRRVIHQTQLSLDQARKRLSGPGQ